QKQNMVTPIELLGNDEEPLEEVVVKDAESESPVSPLSSPRRIVAQRTDTDETVFEVESKKTIRMPTPHAAAFAINNENPSPISPAPPVPAPPANLPSTSSPGQKK